MKDGKYRIQTVETSRVFLDQENPRHEPFEDQEEVIAYLCKEEKVLALAKDIAKNGLNPLELFAIIKEGDDAFYAAEGNRRLCAIKLLNDPDLAQTDFRNKFVKISKEYSPIRQLQAIEFSNRDDARLWLERTHAGQNNGRGRKPWNAVQKARHSNSSKNDLALAILDYGEKKGFISPKDREGRLSTVQRYLGNPLMRDALGLTKSDGDQLTTDLPNTQFNVVFKKFMEDIAKKNVTTRDNKNKIVEYSHELRRTEGVTGQRTHPHDLLDDKPSKPKKPKKMAKIKPNDDLQDALKHIANHKLNKLYYSLCSLTLSEHTPLLYVGLWAFIETLTALCGRKSGTDFCAYLSSQKMESLGLGGKKDTKAIADALKRISEFGNSTKHDKIAAAFNGEQLANDFETMGTLLVTLAKGAKGKS